MIKKFTYLKFFLLVSIFVTFFSYVSVAQQINQINYQGVARKADGSPVAEQNVTLRLSIHDGGANSPVVYSETRTILTNKFGLFTTIIGSSGASSQTGNFSTIIWATGNKFLQVEIDPTGGNSFLNMGTSQLQSVPYAIYASQAAPAGTASGDLSGSYPNPIVSKIQGAPISTTAPQNGQVLRWNGSLWIPDNLPTSVTQQPITISATAPLSVIIGNGNANLSLNRANAINDGFLAQTDWVQFNDKTSKAYVDAAVANASIPDASPTIKGKIQLSGDLSGTADQPVIANGKITNSKIADGAITTTKLIDGVITDAKIANGINAFKVGLGNVNNTADLDKPISTATQNALNLKSSTADLSLKAPIASPTFTGTVSGISKAMVGLGNVDNTADLDKPISTATQTALNSKSSTADLALKAPIASPTFTGTVSGISKAMVGLGNLDNTADLDKPISTATQTALNLKSSAADLALKAPIASPTFTGTVFGISKAMVGLGNADNTADLDKPISTATQTALDLKGSAADLVLKAPIASPTFTGTVSGISKAMVGLGNADNTADLDKPISTATQTALDLKGSAADLALKAPIASPTFTGTVSGISKAMVGMGNVDNTADLDKPISTATQTALDLKGSAADLALKAPIASPTFTGTVSGISKAMVGLGNVDNTADLDKPISTATQTALDLKGSAADLASKAPIASPTFTGTVSGISKAMVGLGNVDNTADLDKPISTATQTALDLKGSAADLDSKAPIASPTFTGTVSGISKAMVGLGNADNTADLDKPISTATQTVLDARELISNKSLNIVTDASSDIKYPSVKSVKAYVDAAVTAVREVADEFTATASQTSFSLTQTPSSNSKIKMYVNGIRISNSAYTSTSSTLTYVPANNGGYVLTSGDRIQFDYFY
ncbi:MAG: hypothetical protein V4546_09345 [Bacteroidota bacterium]